MPRDLARHELQAPSLALVVEENPARRVQVVALAIVHRDEVPIDLGHPIGGAGIERRRLRLWHLQYLAEHLAAARLVEARTGAHFAHRLKHARHAHARELRRQRRLDPRHRHERHRRQVVDLAGIARAQRVHQRALIEQVALVQRYALAQVLDAIELLRRGAAHHAVHLIPLLQQELRQIGAVLAGDPGDERAAPLGHGRDPIVSCSRSHCTVAATPSRTPILASQPSISLAFWTEGQRRTTSTVKLGRCSRANS